HLDKQYQDHAKPDRVDAILQEHRIEQRYCDDDHAEAFDETAEHRIEHEQRAKKFQPRQLQTHQELRKLLADASIGDRVGEGVSSEAGMGQKIEHGRHEDREGYRHPDAKKGQKNAEDEDQLDAGTHRTAPARRYLTLAAMVRNSATHNSAMPI